MSTVTAKTKVRRAMGRNHKTAAEIARAAHLSEGQVRKALAELASEGYTKQDRFPDGSYGYRRVRVPRKRPRGVVS